MGISTAGKSNSAVPPESCSGIGLTGGPAIITLNVMMRIMFFLLLGFVAADAFAAERDWTNLAGKAIRADFGGVEKDHVVLIMSDRSRAWVKIDSLSNGDQEWIKDQPGQIAPPIAPKAPPEARKTPELVSESVSDSTIRVIHEKPGDCLYESAHFRFKTTARLGAALITDVCRVFESTYQLVRRMPWGIMPEPEAGRVKFQAELYETREQYLATGAPPWSAGIYSHKDRVFRIPFNELGINGQKGAGGSYFRTGEINNNTISHEVTHQMMHGLIPYLPAWLVEGLADYTANIPYRGGVFQVRDDASVFKERTEETDKPKRQRGLLGMVKYEPNWRGVDLVWSLTTQITQLNPIKKFTLSEEDLSRPRPARQADDSEPDMTTLADHYHSSHVLSYFFVRDRGGIPLMRFMDAVHAEAQKWPTFWKALDDYKARVAELRPLYERFDSEMREFVKKPGVTQLPDGRVSYPIELTPPSRPPELPKPPMPPDMTDPEAVCAKHVHLLLDGRNLQQLRNQVHGMFPRIGYDP